MAKIKPQTYSDGVVRIYDVSNDAEKGDMPVFILTEKEVLRYSEKSVGLIRYTGGLQDNVKIERLIRTQRRPGVSAQDFAVTNDGKVYKIVRVQYPDDPIPKAMDLSLERVEQRYEISG
jgi:hypothetical protein